MTSVRAERPSMEAYGVGEGWTPLPWAWAAERLRASRNLWLVTVSAEGRPHAMPVWGVWDDDELRLAFSCAPRARKARNLAASPQVVVAAESTVEVVSLEGRAAPVPPGERAEAWIERYLAKYVPLQPDLTAGFIRSNALYEVVPERAFGVVEREDEFSTRATRWAFG